MIKCADKMVLFREECPTHPHRHRGSTTQPPEIWGWMFYVSVSLWHFPISINFSYSSNMMKSAGGSRLLRSVFMVYAFASWSYKNECLLCFRTMEITSYRHSRCRRETCMCFEHYVHDLSWVLRSQTWKNDQCDTTANSIARTLVRDSVLIKNKMRWQFTRFSVKTRAFTCAIATGCTRGSALCCWILSRPTTAYVIRDRLRMFPRWNLHITAMV